MNIKKQKTKIKYCFIIIVVSNLKKVQQHSELLQHDLTYNCSMSVQILFQLLHIICTLINERIMIFREKMTEWWTVMNVEQLDNKPKCVEKLFMGKFIIKWIIYTVLFRPYLQINNLQILWKYHCSHFINYLLLLLIKSDLSHSKSTLCERINVWKVFSNIDKSTVTNLLPQYIQWKMNTYVDFETYSCSSLIPTQIQ